MSGKKSLSKGEQVIFWEKFGRLLSLGFPIFESLDMIAEDSSNPLVSEITKKVSERIKSKETITDVLKEYPQVFSNLTIKFIEQGETYGMLDKCVINLVGILKTEIDYSK